MATALQKLTATLTGIPDLATAQQKATQARRQTIEADAAVSAARAALALADDAQDPGEIQRCEAGLAAANLVLERAARTLEVAERRLRQAQDAESAIARADGMKALHQATQRHQAAAKRADAAVQSLAGILAELDDADAAISALQRQGVGSPNAVSAYNYGPGVTRSRIRQALEHAKVLPGSATHSVPPLAEWSSALGTLLLTE